MAFKKVTVTLPEKTLKKLEKLAKNESLWIQVVKSV